MNYLFGDPYGIRTHVTAVKGPYLKPLDQRVIFGEPSATRTRDTLIKSQVLYRAELMAQKLTSQVYILSRELTCCQLHFLQNVLGDNNSCDRGLHQPSGYTGTITDGVESLDLRFKIRFYPHFGRVKFDFYTIKQGIATI